MLFRSECFPIFAMELKMVVVSTVPGDVGEGISNSKARVCGGLAVGNSGTISKIPSPSDWNSPRPSEHVHNSGQIVLIFKQTVNSQLSVTTKVSQSLFSNLRHNG